MGIYWENALAPCNRFSVSMLALKNSAEISAELE
jgi:hypothetical protein